MIASGEFTQEKSIGLPIASFRQCLSVIGIVLSPEVSYYFKFNYLFSLATKQIHNERRCLGDRLNDWQLKKLLIRKFRRLQQDEPTNPGLRIKKWQQSSWRQRQ